MKVLGFCGTHKKKSMLSTSWFVMNEALKGAQAKGAEIDTVRISDYNIIPCAGCGKCFSQEPCPLYSSPKDDLVKVIQKLNESDAIIFCSPVYAYGQPAMMHNFWHRCRIVHEKERSSAWGTDIVDLERNPFAGKPIVNIAVCAGLGHEQALNDIFRYSTALVYTSVISLGLTMFEFDSESKVKPFSEAEFAINMAKEAGGRLVDMHHNQLFQSMKYLFRY